MFGIVTAIFITISSMGAAIWSNHTHVGGRGNNRPPDKCQVFDYRYAPEYKAMCDKWDAEHGK
jgi:hypothetical protein